MSRKAPSAAAPGAPEWGSGAVYVLPNGHTAGLAALLAAMWYAGASQSNGAAYLLCFVLTSGALVSILHAWSNLRGLKVSAGAIKPAFAGDLIEIPLTIRGRERREHLAVQVRHSKGLPVRVDRATSLPVRVQVSAPAARRGRYETVTVRLSSLFPFGFFSARSTVTLTREHIIYPAPHGSLALPRPLSAREGRNEGMRVEGDDFAGVRAYRPGESQRHIDWKAAARGQALLVKQWAGSVSETLDLSWEATAGLDYEARLSQLTQWVRLAEQRGARSRLQLPGRQPIEGAGAAHCHACFRALATHPEEGAAA